MLILVHISCNNNRLTDHTGWALENDQSIAKTSRDLYDWRMITQLWIDQIGFNSATMEGTPVFYRSNENENFRLVIEKDKKN